MYVYVAHMTTFRNEYPVTGVFVVVVVVVVVVIVVVVVVVVVVAV